MGAFTRYDVYETELRKLIEERIESISEEISFGLLKTHEEYKSVTGKIAGLRAALDLMDEASSVTNKKIGA